MNLKSLTAPFTKALAAFRHTAQSGPSWLGFGGRAGVNYAREVGSLLDASVVMAPVQWLQSAVPQARLTVTQTKKNGDVVELENHAALQLIRKPNAFYGDDVMWGGIVLSLCLDGNGFLMIARNGLNQPAELWYVPHWMLEPKWPRDGSEFISHYEYTPGGGVPATKVDPDDVIHFRLGLNPNNMRKGIAPLRSAIREIFMDNESSAFVSALLKNMGVPGVVISPKGGGTVATGDVEATKAYFEQQFAGDRRGKPLVMGSETVVSQFGFNPQQLSMGDARNLAEERICALLKIPPAVVGFGTGLDTTKVGATMEAMIRLAWVNGVLPILGLLADEVQRSLLPQFGNPAGLKAEWITDKVRALQEDEDKLVTRWGTKLTSGAITVYEYRVGVGLEADDSHRFYLRSFNQVEVPESETPEQRATRLGPVEPAPVEVSPAPAGKAKTDDHEEKARASAAGYKRAAAFAAAVQAQESALTKTAETRLRTLFEALGTATAKAAKPLVKLIKSDTKPDDASLVDQILARLGIAAWQTSLKSVLERNSDSVNSATGKVADAQGIEANAPDKVARAVIAAGGKRAKLVDLDEQTKSALFEALAEGRAAGEGPDALATRIQGMVEGGPWKSAETRARVIARTETKFAQNTSTIERGVAGGTSKFVVFDGRFGPGRSKPDHIARDGSIVDADRAREMADAEHPNGTLSFAPNF
jgi:HK97 family phage portal protein